MSQPTPQQQPSTRTPMERKDFVKLAISLLALTIALATFFSSLAISDSLSHQLATGNSVPANFTGSWIVLAIGLPFVVLLTGLAIGCKPVPASATEPTP